MSVHHIYVGTKLPGADQKMLLNYTNVMTIIQAEIEDENDTECDDPEAKASEL